jgi:hypothetical protein
MGAVCSRGDDVAHDNDGANKAGEKQPANKPEVKEAWKEPPAAADTSSKPPTTRASIMDYWPAGHAVCNAPPHYIPERFGAFVHQEKVPPQTLFSGTFRCSALQPPPRAAAVGDEPSNDGLTTVLNASDALFVRAYLPHSLTSIPVGWARPNIPADELIDGFQYNTTESGGGKVDESVLASSGHIERVEERKKVILFPSRIRSVGLFVSVNGRENALTTETVETAFNGSQPCPPIPGSFLTLSMTNAEGESVSAAKAENSISFTVFRRDQAGSNEPPSRAAETWAKEMLDLPDGDHAVTFTLKCCYDARYMHAIYARGTAGRVVGTYTDMSLANDAVSESLASLRTQLLVTEESKNQIREWMNSRALK